MGKFSVASTIASKTGKSLEEAKKFVDDVGVNRAQRVADDLAGGASRTVSKWWKPALAGGGLAGGGALAWRQQDLEQARAIADQQRSYSGAVESIMNSDLPPEKKQELVENLTEESPASDSNKDDDDDSGGWWKEFTDALPDGVTGLQGQVIMIIVLLAVLRYTLGSDG